MKIQDILFLIFFIGILLKRDERWFVVTGLICIALSMPLFLFWIFFTAQRLVYYAFFLLLAAAILFLIKKG